MVYDPALICKGSLTRVVPSAIDFVQAMIPGFEAEHAAISTGAAGDDGDSCVTVHSQREAGIRK